MLKKSNILLFLIIIIASLLRLISLDKIPIGFNDDEAAFGYNAYSILKTGKDEWTRTFPFPVFESFGDWKLVTQLYLTTISVSLFGLSEFSTRLPSAIFGILAVVATYLLTKELFNFKEFKANPNIAALIAAFLLAISPWHIIASRNAFESDLLTFSITFATLLFLKGLKENKFLTLSFISFAISFYIYRSSWLFIPLFLTCLIYFFRKNLDFKSVFKNLSIMFILILPLIPVLISFHGQSRFFQESFLTGTSRTGITNDINEQRGICSKNLPPFFCLIIFNKYISFGKAYSGNYIQNLSFKTYFENANPTGFQSFATRGVFHLFELPILIIGAIFLFKNKQAAYVLIPWILLTPVGASFAGIGNYGRINLIMPAPQIIEALGLLIIVGLLKNYLVRLTFILVASTIILTSTARFIVEMFYIEPFYTSRYQRYGYKQLFDYLQVQKNKYDNIYISKKIDSSHQYIQYLFFEKIDPNYFFLHVQRDRENLGWINMKRIGNFIFVPSIPGIETIPQKTLIVVGNKEMSYPAAPVYTINFLNGDRGFEIYDGDQIKEAFKRLSQTNRL